MVPEIPLKLCNDCGRFFILVNKFLIKIVNYNIKITIQDEYEFEFMKNKKCPFCKVLDKRAGTQKDVFDV